MEIQPDGTLLIRAALDGGFTLCRKVQSVIGPIDPDDYRPYRPNRRHSDIPVNENMYDPREPQSQRGPLDVADRRKSAAARQQMLQERLQQVQKKNPAFSFNQCWQHLQQNEPGLFDGLTVVTHPD